MKRLPATPTDRPQPNPDSIGVARTVPEGTQNLSTHPRPTLRRHQASGVDSIHPPGSQRPTLRRHPPRSYGNVRILPSGCKLLPVSVLHVCAADTCLATVMERAGDGTPCPEPPAPPRLPEDASPSVGQGWGHGPHAPFSMHLQWPSEPMRAFLSHVSVIAQ